MCCHVWWVCGGRLVWCLVLYHALLPLLLVNIVGVRGGLVASHTTTDTEGNK